MAKTSTYSFGVGNVICKAGGVATTIGTLQEVQIDISSTTVQLIGQNQFADAIARGEGKISGKAKTGRLDLQMFASLYLGQAIDSTGFTKTYIAEPHSVPATSTYTFQATNRTGGISDLGVFYANNTGQLTRVSSGSEALGKYSVNETTGVYTFAAADAGAALLTSYTNFATTGNRLVVSNQLMGQNPVFELFLSNGYMDVNGVTYTSLHLFSCCANKISFPFKNKDFVVSDFDFDCFADNLGRIFELGIGT